MYINCLPSYSHIHFITKTKSVITKDFLKYAKRKSMFDFVPNKLSIKQLSWHVSIIQTYLMIKKHKVSICHWSHAFMHNLRFPLRFSFFSMSTSHKWFHLKRVLTTTIPPSYLNFLPLTLLIYNVKQKKKENTTYKGTSRFNCCFFRHFTVLTFRWIFKNWRPDLIWFLCGKDKIQRWDRLELHRYILALKFNSRDLRNT